MKKIVMIIMICLLPVVLVGVYSILKSDPEAKKPAKEKPAPLETKVELPPEAPSSKFFGIPPSGSADPESGVDTSKGEVAPKPLPKVQGIPITGAPEWDDRSAVVENTLAFDKLLRVINTQNKAKITQQMKAYASDPVIANVVSLVDSDSEEGPYQNSKTTFFYMFSDPQTGSRHGKIIYHLTLKGRNYQDFVTLEYAPQSPKIVGFVPGTASIRQQSPK